MESSDVATAAKWSDHQAFWVNTVVTRSVLLSFWLETVRTPLDAARVIPAIKKTVYEAGSDQPIYEPKLCSRSSRSCPRCCLSFFREPGYYVGGMIITYGLTLMVVIPVFLVSLLLPDLSSVSDYGRFALWVLFAVPLSLLLMPYSYSLWLHLDFWFEPWTPQGRS
jgi:hypothetical protein